MDHQILASEDRRVEIAEVILFHHAQETGFGEVIERGVQVVDGLAAGPVYAAFSLGVCPAQTRAGV
jgi:predicted hydrolase (HD superfamily)